MRIDPVSQSPKKGMPSETIATELEDARYWSLDLGGTFSHALQRGDYWLVAYVSPIDPEGGADALASTLATELEENGQASRRVSAAELSALGGFVAPPETVWILSQTAPPCAARVEPRPRLDVYQFGWPAIEIAYPLSGCDFAGAVEVAISDIEPAPAVRWEPSLLRYERTSSNSPDTFAPWRHPMAAFLVSELENRPDGGGFAPPEQTIELFGVDSQPPLLDLFTGIVWDSLPANPNDYNPCDAIVVTNQAVGFLEGGDFTALPLYEGSAPELAGAFVLGDQVAAVVGVFDFDVGILPLPGGRLARARWTVLPSGVYHDEERAFARRQLGPYCGP